MALYQDVYLPGDKPASTIPSPETNSEFHFVRETPVPDDQPETWNAGEQADFEFALDRTECQAFDDIREELAAGRLLTHSDVTFLAEQGPALPGDLQDYLIGRTDERGGQLDYSAGEASVEQLMAALAAKGLITGSRPQEQHIVTLEPKDNIWGDVFQHKALEVPPNLQAA